MPRTEFAPMLICPKCGERVVDLGMFERLGCGHCVTADLSTGMKRIVRNGMEAKAIMYAITHQRGRG